MRGIGGLGLPMGRRVAGARVKRLWHRVFHRYWWTLGWNGQIGSKKRFVHGTLCLSNFNRPIVRWDFHFDAPNPGGFLCFEWGNGNSDPAWSIGVQW